MQLGGQWGQRHQPLPRSSNHSSKPWQTLCSTECSAAHTRRSLQQQRQVRQRDQSELARFLPAGPTAVVEKDLVNSPQWDRRRRTPQPGPASLACLNGGDKRGHLCKCSCRQQVRRYQLQAPVNSPGRGVLGAAKKERVKLPLPLLPPYAKGQRIYKRACMVCIQSNSYSLTQSRIGTGGAARMHSIAMAHKACTGGLDHQNLAAMMQPH